MKVPIYKNVFLWLAIAMLLSGGYFYGSLVNMGTLGPNWPSAEWIVGLSIWCLRLWVILMVASPFVLRWRALWLLLSAPPVLYWLIIDFAIIEACSRDVHNCP